ncbi:MULTISPECIES: amino acid ABC transporter permease [Priestia]|jgi:L-cystine transport system permease protein|uniref:Putative amino acid ABC transporter, permease protein n=1 Tax=Priestia megaterium (strain ATCC 12872 / QMB1551) TaxID=545693 RepID=D5E2J9_PRIM1|nr:MULTISPECIES: amino acid ABC transporter permease [Priestia]AVX07660.1 amino acid ABC transporter permease [Bacillus sp. Y-01]MBZ5478884.1 amino acid ABC transporter permease [Bacillus sp. T_4]MCJ7986846.1 amino acid ABC transporter permease [Priestia sp. OVL9]MDH6655484.1 L-cystine transport system permease protein [Bacillus sp. PvP124]MDP9574366.1 L-cystine transport system permease protein [Bacillus sp. 1751]
MISTDFHDWLKLLWQVVDKLPLTLFMLGLSLLFSLLLGFVIALIRIQKKPVLSKMATIYLSFMRCTPLLVQLFLVYFGLPQLLLLVHIDINSWSRVTFLVIAFSLHTAAPLSEVIRSAYLSIDKGQFEAAYSIGMNYFQSLRRIILPQAFVAALPNLGNATISLLKDTALAFSIGIIDIMGQVRLILGNNYGIGMFEIYVTISLVYWSMCIVIEIIVSYLEKHLKKGRVSISK